MVIPTGSISGSRSMRGARKPYCTYPSPSLWLSPRRRAPQREQQPDRRGKKGHARKFCGTVPPTASAQSRGSTQSRGKGIAFGQVPGQLAQRTTAAVRPKVVLRSRKRPQKLERACSFPVPIAKKSVQLIHGCHATPRCLGRAASTARTRRFLSGLQVQPAPVRWAGPRESHLTPAASGNGTPSQ